MNKLIELKNEVRGNTVYEYKHIPLKAALEFIKANQLNIRNKYTNINETFYLNVIDRKITLRERLAVENTYVLIFKNKVTFSFFELNGIE